MSVSLCVCLFVRKLLQNGWIDWAEIYREYFTSGADVLGEKIPDCGSRSPENRKKPFKFIESLLFNASTEVDTLKNFVITLQSWPHLAFLVPYP